jgi:hypothetical protein
LRRMSYRKRNHNAEKMLWVQVMCRRELLLQWFVSKDEAI